MGFCDNRLASGKGAQSQWPSYKILASSSCATSKTAWRLSNKQPWVDAARIGIDGGSFGGYMVTYVHGAIDENVHAQNTLKFGYELQTAASCSG